MSRKGAEAAPRKGESRTLGGKTRPGSEGSRASGRYSLPLGTRLGNEGEADRVALRVLGNPASAAGGGVPSGPSRPAPGGRLPKSARQPAEELLGFDFSTVRVEPEAKDAEAEGAHAVTRGDTVRFAPGRFRPDHSLGRALIAHELTHVAQQRAAPPLRRTVEDGRDLLGAPEQHRDDIARFRSEREARVLEASHAALVDPLVATTPAPRGLRQRCDGDGKTVKEQEAGDEAKSKKGEAPDAGKAKSDKGEDLPVTPPESLPAEFATYYADVDGAVKALNKRLKPDTPLDPDWLRAMMAVESGGDADARKYDPLQVGNKGDPAFPTLAGKTDGMDKEKKKATLEEHEKTQLIDPDVAAKLEDKEQTPWTKDKSKPRGGYWDYAKVAEDKRMDPGTSIVAAAAWLFHKAAKYDHVVVEETVPKGTALRTHTIQSGDSFAKIAPSLGTTVATLEKYNPEKKVLHPGDIVEYRKASLQLKIVGWRSWKDAIIAYNSKESYYEKVKKKYDEIKAATSKKK